MKNRTRGLPEDFDALYGDSRTARGLLVFLAAALLVVGCKSAEPITPPKPGKTFGRILVDSPEVFGRERLARDRLAQQEWLEEQLEAVDEVSYTGFQGATQRQSLDASRFRAGVDASVGAALEVEKTRAELDAVGRDAELEEIRHRIERLRLEQELEALEASEGDDNGSDDGDSDGSGGDGDSGGEEGGGDASASTQVLDRLLGSETLAADPSQLPGTAITTTSLVDRPQDVFLAKLAFRERIRQELLENNLDDSHDLDGNTLYRLSFDATVFPAEDTSAWAVVEIEMEDPYEDKCSIKESPDLPLVYQRWVDSLELRLNDEVERLTALVLDPNRRDEGLTDLERRFVAQLLALLPETVKNAKFTTGQSDRETVVGYVEQIRDSCRDSREQCELETLKNTVAKAARKVVQQEYQNAINPSGDASFVKIDDDGERLTVCEGSVQTIANFCKALMRRRQAAAISAYAITPKVTVERISQVAASRTARELALGLAATAGAAQFEAAFEKAKVLDAATQAILRQPLVVGFSEMYDPAAEQAKKSELAQVEELVKRAETAANDAEKAKGEAWQAKQKAERAAERAEKASCPQDPGSETSPKSTASPAGDPCRPHQSLGDLRFPETARPVFGWILGPRFQARPDGAGHDFRFVPRPESLAAVISVPAWWGRVQLRVRTCWVTENAVPLDGGRICGDHAQLALPVISAPSEPVEPQILIDRTVDYSVRLAGNSDAVTTALVPSRRQPSARLVAGERLEVGRSGQLVLIGPELWRNPTITLGGQTANDVEILPDMRGLIASFDSVHRPAGWTSQQRIGIENVWVWTSEGRSYAGSAEIHLAPSTSTPGPKLDFEMTVPTSRLAAKDGTAMIAVRFSSSAKKGKELTVFFGAEGAEAWEVKALGSVGSCKVMPKGVEWQINGLAEDVNCSLEVKLRNITEEAVTFTSYREIEKLKVHHPSITLLVGN